MKNKIKITVVGSGYVGMSLAVLLSQHNDVIVLDINSDRVKSINNKTSTVEDNEIQTFMSERKLSLSATLDKEYAYKDSHFVIVATPTDYDPNTNHFDTSSVDNVVGEALSINQNVKIIIKSTIPVGHTMFLQEKYKTNQITFSPEFLREGKALHDNLHPSRIVIGNKLDWCKDFSNLLKQGAEKKGIKTLFVSPSEAEAIKLFANTFLAMRISFFNELDSFALAHNLNAKDIINGVCLDPRIGEGYNNPSFGYGGYCLPKDTKQLLVNYEHVPQTLIKAIVSSNTTRKDFIAEEILKLKPKIIGFFRLVMKKDSDNFRSSAIQGIMKRVKAKGIKVIIFEPQIKEDNFFGSKVFKDIHKFKKMSDIIVTNRKYTELRDVYEKCFSRDIFNEN